MKKHVHFKKLLLGGAAVGLFLAPAFAQDTTEVVTVTGIRASLQSAQSIKQNAEQVVDSITAVDIGALPDRNVAEALQRVPGVTLQRNDSPNDLSRMGSTGNSVFVRGLSWVKTLVNGRDEFSAVDGATLNFADISASLMAGVDVFKSPTAKMIEGGVGGTVDLKTRKPFDNDGLKIAIAGDYTYGNRSDMARPSINGLISDRWETPIGEIGVLLSVDWQDEFTRTGGVNVNPYDCWNKTTGAHQGANDSGYASCMTAALGTTRVMGPTGWAWRQMDFHQQRLASNVVLQWRPNQEWEFTLSGLNSYAHSTDLEHYVFNTLKDDGTPTASPLLASTAKWDSEHNWMGGPSKFDSADTRAGSGHNRNSEIALNIKYNPADRWEVTTDIQFVEASRPYLNNTMYTGMIQGPAWGIDLSSGTPAIDAPAAANLENPANYMWLAAMDHMDYNVAHAWTGKFDVSHTLAGDGLFGFFKSVDVGMRTEQKMAITRSTGYNWGALCPRGWGWPPGAFDGCPLLTGDVAVPYTSVAGGTVTSNNAAVKAINGYAEQFQYQDIFGASMPSLWLPSAALVTMDPVASTALFQGIQNVVTDNTQNWMRWISYASVAGCTGNSLTCIPAYANTTGGNSGGNRIDNQTQATYAAYAQVGFGYENPFGLDIPIDGNFGLRFVHTVNEVNSGKLVMPSNMNANTCAVGDVYPDGTVTNCDQWNQAHDFVGADAGTTVTRLAVKKGYSNLLPSFNLRARVTDEIQARLSYSQTMVRPNFSYTRNNGQLSWTWAGDAGKVGSVAFGKDPSGNGGNPFLKAMTAANYDASVEWYFAPAGSVTLSMFYKDLSNYVFAQTATRSITNPNTGKTLDFQYTTYVNGAHGNLKGFELAYQQYYDMLPGPLSGLGFQANYTKLWNHGGANAGDVSSPDAVRNATDRSLPLEGMSNDSYNVALLYGKYDIDFRLAWSWRSTYMSSASDANNRQPVWLENYGQLDGSLFYTLFDNYKVGVQATNLTGSVFHSRIGYQGYNQRVNWIASDRKYAFIFRANW